ncbi:MAG: type II and III secretion system protein [Candidatus Margulisbacteria bacterium]|nr:type II and III secretion system protein [Candidatus Margulisiibacteriota bacterium]
MRYEGCWGLGIRCQGIILIIICFWIFVLPAEGKIIEQIDFDDAAVLDVVKVLASAAGVDVVVSGKIETRTSVHLKNIEAILAIEQILATNDIAFDRQGDLILISSTPLKRPSKPGAQVLIEAKVLEISESNATKLGLSYGQQTGFFIVGEELTANLKALIAEGSAKVVASPRIATLDDHEAVINIGSRIPYALPVTSGSSSTQWTIDYIDAGVIFKITPQISSDGYITAAIQPEVSSISEWRTTSAGDFPVISTRNARSTLRVKDGETIVVGGLISESERDNISKIPVLGQLPVLGLLFQNKTTEKAKTEIVFMITPRIIKQ